MTTASLELCKELYELSGWESGEWWVIRQGQQITSSVKIASGYNNVTSEVDGTICPAYDLGYLLRKLPAVDEHNDFITLFQSLTGSWVMDYADDEFEADTPEDAACKLAIELFKQDVLTR